MNYNRKESDDSTLLTKTLCAAVFLAFSLLWLYLFQADVLALAQHVLSHGQTSYNKVVGTVVITAVLYLLQLLVYTYTKLNKRFHALTYLPSMLLLTFISDISTDIDQRFDIGAWRWAMPLALVAWAIVAYMAKATQKYERGPSTLFARSTWVNMLILAMMMIGVAAVSNTNAVFHYRAHAETSLLSANYDEALAAGDESLETDESLTMLRIYALSKKQMLPERLFTYALCGTSNAMLPLDGTARTVLLPTDSIFAYLGAIPRQPMPTLTYLRRLQQQHLDKPPVADYMLCAYLIDRDLDKFAQLIKQYYPQLDENLPRHYREALTLYKHLRSHPVVDFKDNVMEEDYADLQQLETKYPDFTERKVRVEERYAGSYWYYYEYLNDKK